MRSRFLRGGRSALVGAVLTSVLTGFLVYTTPTLSGATTPTVSAFKAIPASLTYAGGRVTLSATVNHARRCTFSSTGAISGLPSTVTCTSGSVHKVVTVPANSSDAAVVHTFNLAVTGTTTVHAPSVRVTVPPRVTAISAGGYHTCALLADGIVDCWGDNGYGELGNGTTTNASRPAFVHERAVVTAIAAGYFHTCALLTGGTVDCWGDNADGQLGDGTTTNSSLPVSVSGLSGVTAIAAGYYDTCALLTGGGVDCWGLNANGELGNGTTTDSTTPVSVGGAVELLGATAISVGGIYSCAIDLRDSGVASCWGAGTLGQLGDGMDTDESSPGIVSGPGDVGSLGGVTAVVNGYSRSCALISGGTVDCWGSTDGSSIDSSTPVAVGGLSGVTAIGAGPAVACAIGTAGTVKCWGLNNSGQLGDGKTNNFVQPRCGDWAHRGNRNVRRFRLLLRTSQRRHRQMLGRQSV